MALVHLKFSFDGIPGASIPREWSHSGVVGSGDMEVLLTRREQNGRVNVTVCTPVSGFDRVWELVLRRFVAESGCGDLELEINETMRRRSWWGCGCGKRCLKRGEGKSDALFRAAAEKLFGGNGAGTGNRPDG